MSILTNEINHDTILQIYGEALEISKQLVNYLIAKHGDEYNIKNLTILVAFVARLVTYKNRPEILIETIKLADKYIQAVSQAGEEK